MEIYTHDIFSQNSKFLLWNLERLSNFLILDYSHIHSKTQVKVLLGIRHFGLKLFLMVLLAFFDINIFTISGRQKNAAVIRAVDPSLF